MEATHCRMANPAYRAAALAAAHDPPVGAINWFVDELRTQGRGWVPYVAPTWGGVDAELLLLYRDPGPMTNPDLAGSGFLSAENADPSARRLAWLLDAVDVAQDRCIGWNAYPWYINRTPKAAELDAGVEPLRHVLELLPCLRAVLLCGDHAHASWRRLTRLHPALVAGLTVVETCHTSNQAFWVGEPEQSARKLRQLFEFAEVASALNGDRTD